MPSHVLTFRNWDSTVPKWTNPNRPVGQPEQEGLMGLLVNPRQEVSTFVNFMNSYSNVKSVTMVTPNVTSGGLAYSNYL